MEAFRSIGAYVELFEGEREFIGAAASGRLGSLQRRMKVVYNGIEGSIAHDAFMPGRKALVPAVADSYGFLCANSNAYACALGRHKFHYLSLLSSLGLPTPRTWHYRKETGWAGGHSPTEGLKVIAKSTYESWSVGVTDESIFLADSTSTNRVAAIAERIGQSVTVQEFVAGQEVCVPVLATPELMGTPPVVAVLAKAPLDPEAVMTIDDNLMSGGVTYQALTDQDLVGRLHSLALRAFIALELDAFARIDFRVDESGNPFIFDVGVSPGLSRGSSAFASMSHWGFTHEEFLRAILAASLPASGIRTPSGVSPELHLR
ncbi:D-alanine-D-alanine ligase [Propionicimonas paludicola]|uniref:D-alanine-D-alanine ligase n=1 Tax=Propionicimonas paludicola TaxID=185243 RepID=A0A2A9CPB4_9ACTN|nr:D-alanine-D-alanine ligase [Propionicimonas paludicola]PFG18459.1 D-alanine-D-alanine ligase [Propionicimonas paludicola]